MELYKYEITKEVAAKWFDGGVRENGIPTIKVSTLQAWGKKTVVGIHVTLVNIEKREDYSMEYSTPYQIPCVRIPLEKALPPSRKQFNETVKAACKRWTYDSNLSLEHPYRKAIEHFIGIATG